jgi:hypothetical protein
MQNDTGVPGLGYEVCTWPEWGHQDGTIFVYLIVSRVTSESEDKIMVKLEAPLARKEGDQGWSSGIKLIHCCMQGTDNVFCLLFGLAGSDAFHACLDSKLSVVLGSLVYRVGSRVWADRGTYVGGQGGGGG